MPSTKASSPQEKSKTLSVSVSGRIGLPPNGSFLYLENREESMSKRPMHTIAGFSGITPPPRMKVYGRSVTINEKIANTFSRAYGNLLVMRPVGRFVVLTLLFGSGLLLSTTPAHSCVFSATPIKVEPTFSVHVFNDLGPVEGLKIKIVRIGSRRPLTEATTNNKGIAAFQLDKQLRGGRLFLQPEHTVMGWQWPELDIVADTSKASIEIQWPSRILRITNLHGTIQVQDLAYPPHLSPLAHASLSLRSLVPYQEIATTVTDEKGVFQFTGTKMGLYYLQVNGKSKSDSTVPQGDIPVFIGGSEANEGLSITTRYSDCGLEYQLGKGILR